MSIKLKPLQVKHSSLGVVCFLFYGTQLLYVHISKFYLRTRLTLLSRSILNFALAFRRLLLQKHRVDYDPGVTKEIIVATKDMYERDPV